MIKRAEKTNWKALIFFSLKKQKKKKEEKKTLARNGRKWTKANTKGMFGLVEWE